MLVHRNLAHIEQLLLQGASLTWLSKKQAKLLLVIAEVYRHLRHWAEVLNVSAELEEAVSACSN